MMSEYFSADRSEVFKAPSLWKLSQNSLPAKYESAKVGAGLVLLLAESYTSSIVALSEVFVNVLLESMFALV